MGKKTSIQWSHSTTNPTMGCDGCPLWPSVVLILALLIRSIVGLKIATAEEVEATWKATKARNRFDQALAVIEKFAGAPEMNAAKIELVTRVRAEFRCYAGILHQRFKGNAGYAASFDEPKTFPGRTLKTARFGFPSPAEEVEKPWLCGCPRIVFVSDMSDSLSERIPFDYFLNEVVNPAASVKGARHIWIWLTKRPKRMLEFYHWLEARQIMWPRNLIPSASILSAGYARQATALMQIPSMAKAFSLEPLNRYVELPAELLSPESWFIVGGESGAGAATRPFDIAWARRYREVCAKARAAFFLKQLGAHAVENGSKFPTKDQHGGEWDEWPEDVRVRQVPAVFRAYRRSFEVR